MKKCLLISLLTLSLCSCADKAWRGVTDSDYDDYDDGVAVPVLVEMGNGSPYTTKGSGAVDGSDGREWKNIEVYVYAFRKGAPFTDGVSSGGCLVDGSLDKAGDLGGRRAYYEGTDNYLVWSGSGDEAYYPTGKTAYDFYAYYVDGIQVASVKRSADRISIPVTIDGCTDLMSATASFSSTALEGLSEIEKGLIIKNVFSSYTARRGVNPMLEFRHHLTRLRFEMYPASDLSNTVIINSIRVKSKTSGDFVVVSRDDSGTGVDFPDSSPSGYLTLAEADGSALKQDSYHTDYHGDFSEALYERPHVQVGGTILLAPDDEYKVEMTMREAKGQSYSTGASFTLSRPSGFSAGCQYVVRLGIYGMMDIRPSVAIEPWGTGGNIIIDDEDHIHIKTE